MSPKGARISASGAPAHPTAPQLADHRVERRNADAGQPAEAGAAAQAGGGKQLAQLGGSLAAKEPYELQAAPVGNPPCSGQHFRNRSTALPLVRPGVFAGAMFAVLTSLDNLPLSFFFGSAGTNTCLW